MDLMTALPMVEVQIDGVIGPSHHFGGLGVGNVASQTSRWRPSHPKAAALEGLAKMDCVARLGVPQCFLPPLPRPDWDFLASLGFSGDRQDALKRCGDRFPELLSAAYSSSFMWTANAATTAPSTDTLDGQSHAVMANLCSSLHRGMESPGRGTQLRKAMASVHGVQIHDPLPSSTPLRDEGAANHMRLCGATPMTHSLGLHLFVHEPVIHSEQVDAPKFVSRQGALASRLVAAKLRIPERQCIFLEQTQTAIDAGVFHNDVIATSHCHLLMHHEDAFVNSHAMVGEIRSRFRERTGEDLKVIEIQRRALGIDEAVRTYLFNSQIVTRHDGAWHLICPEQCRQSDATRCLIEDWIGDPSIPIEGVDFVPLSESMANGGGPACLRLRWSLPRSHWNTAPQGYRWNEESAPAIRNWIEQTYAETIVFEDFLRLDFAEHVAAAVAHFPIR